MTNPASLRIISCILQTACFVGGLAGLYLLYIGTQFTGFLANGAVLIIGGVIVITVSIISLCVIRAVLR